MLLRARDLRARDLRARDLRARDLRRPRRLPPGPPPGAAVPNMCWRSVMRSAARSSSRITVRSNSISSTPGTDRATRCTSSARSSEPGHAETGSAKFNSVTRCRRATDFPQQPDRAERQSRVPPAQRLLREPFRAVFDRLPCTPSSSVGAWTESYALPFPAGRVTPAGGDDPSVDYPVREFRSRSPLSLSLPPLRPVGTPTTGVSVRP